jgi:Transglutaminase-like superfamily
MTASVYSLPVKLALGAEALLALAHARLILHRTAPEDVLRRNAAAAARVASGSHAAAQAKTVESRARIAFIIPRMASRLPWRADCLVQALAGQAMLLRREIVSTIAVGTARHPDGRFEAHAWLVCEKDVILGGDIARFAPLIDSQREGGSTGV